MTTKPLSLQERIDVIIEMGAFHPDDVIDIVHEQQALLQQAVEAFTPLSERAAIRWRALPKDSFEKKTLYDAKQTLAAIKENL